MDSSKILLEKINKNYKDHYKKSINRELQKSYNLAKLAYYGEKRLSGRPVLDHCLNTALHASYIGLDKTSIFCALLHESYLHGVTYEDVCNEVDPKTAELLENYLNTRNIKAKYDHINTSENTTYEYIQRLIITFAKDTRAVLVRLCEKLDNLQDVEFLPKEKQKIVFDNAFNIYSPMSELLGVNYLKSSIDELAFNKSNPKEYRTLHKVLGEHEIRNKKAYLSFSKNLKSGLQKQNIKLVDFSGRVKGVYSFYNKINSYQKKFGYSRQEAIKNIKDKVAYRVIVQNIKECYIALDYIHTNYKFDLSELDDYIKDPKPNGYKSIQTTIEVLPDTYVEIQIRTLEMHQFNEYGPASHAFYKIYGDKKSVDENKLQTVKKLVKWKEEITKQKGVSTHDLHPTILAITPKGDVFELPKLSTPVDFAYKVHSSIGDKTLRAKVDNKLVPLSYPLTDGCVVEVSTSKNDKVNVRWLEFVKTKEAKIHIKKSLKKLGKL